MSSERRRAMDGPSARAVGQAGETKEPDEVGRISGGGLSFGDFSLATQRKVTRPGPKGGRNSIEEGVLASCVAKPRHQGHPQDWEFGLTPPGSRTSEYAVLFEPTIR